MTQHSLRSIYQTNHLSLSLSRCGDCCLLIPDQRICSPMRPRLPAQLPFNQRASCVQRPIAAAVQGGRLKDSWAPNQNKQQLVLLLLLWQTSCARPLAAAVQGGRLEDDWAPNQDERPAEVVEQETRKAEAHNRAVVLEMIGDLPEADAAPPSNMLFVCKLNQVGQGRQCHCGMLLVCKQGRTSSTLSIHCLCASSTR